MIAGLIRFRDENNLSFCINSKENNNSTLWTWIVYCSTTKINYRIAGDCCSTVIVDDTRVVDGTGGVGDDVEVINSTAGVIIDLAAAVVRDSTTAVVGNCIRVVDGAVGVDGTRVGDHTTGEVGNGTAVAKVTRVVECTRVGDGTKILEIARVGDGST